MESDLWKDIHQPIMEGPGWSVYRQCTRMFGSNAGSICPPAEVHMDFPKPLGCRGRRSIFRVPPKMKNTHPEHNNTSTFGFVRLQRIKPHMSLPPFNLTWPGPASQVQPVLPRKARQDPNARQDKTTHNENHKETREHQEEDPCTL